MSDCSTHYARFTIDDILLNPFTIVALKKMKDPAPNPPAAPPPGNFYASLLKYLMNCLFKFIIPLYSFYNCSLFAPF